MEATIKRLRGERDDMRAILRNRAVLDAREWVQDLPYDILESVVERPYNEIENNHLCPSLVQLVEQQEWTLGEKNCFYEAFHEELCAIYAQV